MNPSKEDRLNELRQRAEAVLEKTTREKPKQLTPQDIKNLVHDLSVYQIELELQNEELRASQQVAEKTRDNYIQLYNQAPIGYLTLSQQGIILKSNQTFADMMGVDLSLLIGKQLADLMDEPTRRIFLGRFNAFFKSPQEKSIDVCFRKYGGSMLWGRITGRTELNPLFSASKEILQQQLLITISDISESKQAEEALKKSEERLSLVLKGTNDGLWDWDITTDQRDYSAKWWTMLGYVPGEFPLNNNLWQRLMHPDDKTRANQLFQEALEGSTDHYEVEIRLLHKDGHFVPILTRGFILRDESGKPIRVSGTNMDLTNLKQIEEDLRKSEDRLMQAQAVAHIGNWELNFANGMVWASPETFRIYGVERQSPYTPLDEVQNILLPEERPGLDLAMKNLLDHNEPYDLEYRILRRGEVKPRVIHTVASLVRDEHGTPARLMGLVQDITDQKEAEEKIRNMNLTLEQHVKIRTSELEAAIRDLTSLSYSIAHDLKTPLRALNGFSHALQEEYSQQLDHGGVNYLNRIVKVSIHMEHLLAGLLTFLQVSRTEIEVTEVNLSNLAQGSIQELKRLHPERNVEFICPEDLSVRADLKTISIAVDHLLSNAWKFTNGRNPQRIELGQIDQNGKSIFYVRDTGIGFDMAYTEKLFGVFQRMHPNTHFEGTGIGLAIVKRIVDRHGGKIWAESKTNQGATFYFTLA